VTAPRLVACYFRGVDRADRWPRLAGVLAFTATRHCPTWTQAIAALPPPGFVHDANARLFQANTLKLEHWRDQVLGAADGDRMLLIDADTVILRPLEDVWGWPFDVAYTTKAIPPSARVRNVDRFKFNGGVVFLRVSAATRRFVTLWADENRRMLEDPKRHGPWLSRCGGINQAAFGKLLHEGALADLQLHELPCAEWNCEDSTWAAFDADRTRILHIKSDLRGACFLRYRETPELDPLRKLWQGLDRQANADLLRTA
jgi:hypothetical protein